jgi:TolA-binding protein
MNIGPADDKIDFRVAEDNAPVRSKGLLRLFLILLALAAASLLAMVIVQQKIISTQGDQKVLQDLQRKVSADESRIQELEKQLSNCSPGVTSVPSSH